MEKRIFVVSATGVGAADKRSDSLFYATDVDELNELFTGLYMSGIPRLPQTPTDPAVFKQYLHVYEVGVGYVKRDDYKNVTDKVWADWCVKYESLTTIQQSTRGPFIMNEGDV